MSEQVLLEFITQYGQWAVLLCAFSFGESVIISAGFLAATGVLLLPNVYILALIGTLISDSIWFLFGHLILSRPKRLQQSSERYQRVVSRIEHITGDKPFLILLFMKFLYGTRILTILYLSHRKLGFGTFLFFDAIGTMVWLAVMLGIGWLAGRGITNLFPQAKQLQYAFTILVAAAIISKLVTLWIKSQKK